ncbi:MAG: AAA family ATPase [Bacteroidales bacterium]|nr:AAA family ATPase [Bacteroidales bacterium]MCF8389993.1 AAA family ATPase [Bacteroidales bacterium]
MWIQKICIKNYRLFGTSENFELNNLNIPNQNDEGSGLTVFVGENGSGKTSLLEAISLPLLSYKSDGFSITDFNNPNEKVLIEVLAEKDFDFDGTMPNAHYKGKGFSFEAGLRTRENKAFLSSVVVHDQKFIKADGQDKPKENSPDLRVSVNNPFKGTRFSENDILFLDKNRIYQIRKGSYNTTRFDRLMEDFDFQYVKNVGSVENLHALLDEKVKKHIEHKFLEKAVSKFREISNIGITLNLFKNWNPFENGFFGEKLENQLQISIGQLGSGFEMIFTFLYSFYLSEQSGKDLIALVDEPELHLHPTIQNEFVRFLLEASKKSQIFLTTHSPLLIKQLLKNDKVRVLILQKSEDKPKTIEIEQRVLPYVSANEINFLAFDLPTEEYHNELYGYLQETSEKFTEKDLEDYLVQNGVSKTKKWQRERDGTFSGNEYEVTIHTFIRNKIHHPENKTMRNALYTVQEIKKSIDDMRILI